MLTQYLPQTQVGSLASVLDHVQGQQGKLPEQGRASLVAVPGCPCSPEQAFDADQAGQEQPLPVRPVARGIGQQGVPGQQPQQRPDRPTVQGPMMDHG
jgi:hypothetical protein